MLSKVFVFLALLVACTCAQQEWTSGVATFTGEDVDAASSVSNGACGYGSLSPAQYPGLKLAGIPLATSVLRSTTLKGCGSCLEIRCADKEACADRKASLTVQVVDDCDKCEANQVNLQAAPFAKLASNLDVGRIAIQFRQVPCAFEGGVVTRVDSFRASGGGWVRLLFKNVNGAPLAKVELSKAGTNTWRSMRNVFGAAWEASRLPALPWDIRLTNEAGKSLVLTNAITTDKTGDAASTNNFEA